MAEPFKFYDLRVFRRVVFRDSGDDYRDKQIRLFHRFVRRYGSGSAAWMSTADGFVEGIVINPPVN